MTPARCSARTQSACTARSRCSRDRGTQHRTPARSIAITLPISQPCQPQLLNTLHAPHWRRHLLSLL